MDIHSLSETEYFLTDVFIDNIHQRPYCIFDLEGTGIIVEDEYITQFGAVIYQQGEILRSFNSLVKSPKKIPDGVSALTGITNESLRDAPTFAEVYERFLDFCGTNVLVTQAGYEYDLPMIRKHCRNSNLSMFEKPVIDTKALFAKLHPELNDVFSTDYLVAYYRIDTTDIKRHDALGDCILIRRILDAILLEYKQIDLSEFNLMDGLRVKRFIIPAMYLKKGGFGRGRAIKGCWSRMPRQGQHDGMGEFHVEHDVGGV